MMGFELMTSSLPRMRSTPELHRQKLERGRRIELPFPAWRAGIIAIIRTPQQIYVGEDGFEPPKVKPADLQSAPFGHSGTHPFRQFLLWRKRADGGSRTHDLEITNHAL